LRPSHLRDVRLPSASPSFHCERARVDWPPRKETAPVSVYACMHVIV
jgi:hypothetical protein